MKKYLNVKVTGFRSLKNTSFRINEGLNVLVGPNGSGKTNVAALLDFVSTFLQSGLYAAVADAGGAVRVFSFESFQSESAGPARMTISINGRLGYSSFGESIFSYDTKHDDASDLKEKKKTGYNSTEFSYHLALSLDREKFTISIDRETLSWTFSGNDIEKKFESVTAGASQLGDCTCSFSLDSESIRSKFKSMFAGAIMESLVELHDIGASLSDKLYENARSGASIFKILTPFAVPDLMEVRSALGFDRSSNIDPDKVREDQDIASSGSAKSNGSGVVGELYRLGEGQKTPRSSRKKGGRVISSYDRILDGFYRINDHIISFSVSPNIRTGKLDAILTVGDSRSNIDVPFSWSSDGTAKWLAILTLLRTRDSGYCIEEPENYIHPAAQRMFVAIIRDILAGKDKPFYLINTHSETIVNELTPSELMVCDYSRGTRIRRISNPDRVRKVINETGFGLGHLYANQRV